MKRLPPPQAFVRVRQFFASRNISLGVDFKPIFRHESHHARVRIGI
jgi:hypothetical protein